MAAPKGNRFWEARSSHGAKPKFENGDDLWAACIEYFVWVADNPLEKDNLVTYEGKATHEQTSLMRAMTIDGLCLFLDVTVETWCDWRANRQDLSDVITRAEIVIRSQKFSGAAAGLLNANIIARDLGLSDKSELTGKGGGPIQTQQVAATEADLIEQARSLAIDPSALGLNEGDEATA